MAIICLMAVAAANVVAQGAALQSDVFQQRVGAVELNQQDVVDGVAMVSREAGLVVAVEYPLGATISGSGPALKKIDLNVGPGTVSQILDELCTLDPTFGWEREGNMVNLIPSSVAKDPNYLLNRKIDEFALRGVKGADEAVIQIADQLPGAREQIAVLQTGGSVTFSRPWSVTLKNITVRQALDAFARELGPSYGWQFAGAQDFRIVTFHQGLLPKPPRSKKK